MPAATPAPPSPTLPGPPLNVGTAVEWALRTYLRRLGVLVGLTALLVAPVTIATSLYADVPVAGNVVGTAQSFLPLLVDDGPWWLLALKILGQVLLWPAYLVALNREAVGTYLGEPPPLGFVLRQGIRRWRSMLWITILMAVVYLAAGAIVLAITLLVRDVGGADTARLVSEVRARAQARAPAVRVVTLPPLTTTRTS